MASWSICAFGHREFDVMTDAIANGGHCRVGFENNLYLKDGSLAPSNADLVRQLAETCQPASRAETLALFALNAILYQLIIPQPAVPKIPLAGKHKSMHGRQGRYQRGLPAASICWLDNCRRGHPLACGCRHASNHLP